MPLLIAIVVGFICLVIFINERSDDKAPTIDQALCWRQPAHVLDRLPDQFIVVDLETTGLHSGNHRIIEIAAVRYTPATGATETYQTLVTRKSPLPREIVSLTGITDLELKEHGIPESDAMIQLLAFIGDLPIVSYNIEFDMKFLGKAASRAKLTFDPKHACALWTARNTIPGLSSYRLVSVAKELNIRSGQQHRALGDAMTALHVFLACVERGGPQMWIQTSIASSASTV